MPGMNEDRSNWPTGEESISQRMANFQSTVGGGNEVGGQKWNEEYELLYEQLSSYWPEKDVKEEITQKEHKY